MNRFLHIIFLFFFLQVAEKNVCSQKLIVSRAPFSTRLNDEFSPVYYKGGIVFCSNIRDNSLAGYSDDKTKLFNICFVRGNDSTGWGRTELFSRELTTAFNDGPATFNSKGNIIYFSRNNSVKGTLRDISDSTNKLGLYSAELQNGMWTNIKPFPYNDPLHRFCTPSYAPDEDRIYFSSDMPGGYGGMDIYYCDRNNDSWEKPVNIGPLINTGGNESFPFACRYRKLYFSSDGHKGMGGKDLYYTQNISGKWILPVALDSSVNSPADDFGIVIDSTFEKGYFSSSRLKSDDIFRFSAAPPVFTICDTVLENKFCYTFYDERHNLIDTVKATYFWNFGEGVSVKGTEVRHCFPGPGHYKVNLIITDDLTGDTISEPVSYDVDLEYYPQAYIISPDTALSDKPVTLTLRNDLKNFKPTDYLWDMGDGFLPGGISMIKSFRKKGEYFIRVGLLGEKGSDGTIPQKCYMKKIIITDSFRRRK